MIFRGMQRANGSPYRFYLDRSRCVAVVWWKCAWFRTADRTNNTSIHHISRFTAKQIEIAIIKEKSRCVQLLCRYTTERILTWDWYELIYTRTRKTFEASRASQKASTGGCEERIDVSSFKTIYKPGCIFFFFLENRVRDIVTRCANISTTTTPLVSVRWPLWVINDIL